MKRASAATRREADLERQRALIRSLIERHGWAAPASRSARTTALRTTPLDNIIQFPMARRGT
jgi:hypothetical protein